MAILAGDTGNAPPSQPAGDWFTQQGPPPAAPATAPPQQAPGGTAPAPAPQDPQAYFNSLIAGKPGTPETLISLEGALGQQGIKVLRNASGTAGKIQLPNGAIIDVIRAAGAGGGANNWQWDPGPGPGGGAAGGPNYGMLSGGTGSLAGLAAGALETSPGFQFRLQEGMKALDRSAAAKGTLLTGGQLKGLTRYAQDYASNEYGQNYNRLFGEQAARYQQLYGLSNLGLSAAGQAAGVGTSYAGQAGNILGGQAQNATDAITGGANAGAAGTVGAANATNAGINGVSNAAMNAYMMWLMQQQGRNTGGGGM